MIKTSKDTTRRLLDIHGWSGILLGLALYVVVLTGSIVVFSHEIGAWSVSGHKMDHALAGKIDGKLTELAGQVDPEYLHDVNIWQNSAGYLVAFFHTHVTKENGMLTDQGTRFVLNPETLEVVSRSDGYGDDMPQVQSSYLEDFFIDLHVQLHAPDPIGLYLTGILGLVLLVSAVTGLILHRHLIKDMFLSPRLSSRVMNTRDRHNLAGTWSIVFSILVAFTGAFYSFALTLGLPVLAITAFEGDQQRAAEAIFGTPSVEDDTPKAFVGLEGIVARVQQKDAAGSIPVFIVVEHWGRADAKLTTIHEPHEDTLFFSSHAFNGVTGEYLGQKPSVGTKPSLGDKLVGLMGVLHFGWFAGLLSKIIWLSLGLATCYVTLSGMQLWVQRREEKLAWRQMARLLAIVGFGTPIAMSTAAMGFILSYARHPELVQSWTVNGFWLGVLLSFVVGFMFNRRDVRDTAFKAVMGVILIVLPMVRLVTGDQGWGEHWASNNAVVVGMDLSLLLSGAIFLVMSSGLIGHMTFTKERSSIGVRQKQV